MVTITIKCTEAIASAVMKMLTALDAVAADYRPENLQFEVAEATERRSSSARTHYWAKLPKLPDGTFDMAAVDETVQKNLEALGAHTVNGIIYGDIVAKTIRGDIATERGLREERMMKAGSSQRAMVQLYAWGLIDRGPIAEAGIGELP